MPNSNSFGTKNLPYAYPTIKFKCFKASSELREGCTHAPDPASLPQTHHTPLHPSHTCTKEGHSCLRNIVSFKKLPGRNTFRRIGRAFMHGVRSTMPGYGLPNLSKGRDSVLGDLEKQFSRPVPKAGHLSCVQCGSCLKGPTLYTADAGQSYEMIKPEKIESSFSQMFKA